MSPEDVARGLMLVFDRPSLHEPLMLLADAPSRKLLTVAMRAQGRYAAVASALAAVPPSLRGDAALDVLAGGSMGSSGGDGRLGNLLLAVADALHDPDVIEAFVDERRQDMSATDASAAEEQAAADP